MAWIDLSLARILFTTISASVLAWAVLHKRPQAWPLFLSAPFVIAVIWAQWAPLLSAVALLPGLLPLALTKPNLGLPILLMRRPSMRSLLVCASIVLLSLIVLPSWPLDWLHNTGTHDSVLPLLSWPGTLLPLALLAWRDERARMLLGMAVMPQRFYDPLMLWLIPETSRGGIVLSALSWVVCGPWLVFGWPIPVAHPEYWSVVGLLYLPALLMVLWGARSVAQQKSNAPTPQLLINQVQQAQE